MKNKIEDLRNHLFATLEGLADKDEPLALDRAKAISEVAQTLINCAKVEVEFIKATGIEKAKFFTGVDSVPRIDSQSRGAA